MHGPVRLDRPLDRLLLHVGGKAQVHWPGPPTRRHPERLVPDGGKPIRPERQDAVARHLLEDVDDVDALAAGLLERPSSKGLRGDLPGEHDDRDRIGVGGGDPGDQVGGARARCRDACPESTARARVAVGHERGPGLVLRHDDLGLPSNRGREQGEHGPADHAEDVPDANVREGFDQILSDLAVRRRPRRYPVSDDPGLGGYLHRCITHGVVPRHRKASLLLVESHAANDPAAFA